MGNGNGSYLYVKNWSKFQHYGNRVPRWIKLYCSILTDPKFEVLSDRDKGHLVLLWVMAALHGGSVPNDPNYLRRHLGLHHNPDLKLFINQGWLSENASTLLAQTRIDKNRIDKRESKPVDKSLGKIKISNQLPDYLYRKPNDIG